MRALVIDGPRRHPTVRDDASPTAGAGQLLVAVRSSAVSGLDLAIMEGRLLDETEHVFPVTLGRSYSGVVEEVGDGVEGYAVGDRVLGVVLGSVVQLGAWAERIAVPADDAVAPLPEGVDDAIGGVLGLAGVVAMNLVAATRASEGDVVLVDGDASGIAALAVQLAVHRGAEVLATGTAADEELLTGLGASQVVDPADDLPEAVHAVRPEGVDALIDLVDRGHDAFRTALGVLREGGHAVSSSGAATGAGRPDVDIANVLLEPAPGQLAELASLVADGTLTVPVAETVGLDELDRGLEAFRAGPRGAVVLRVAARPA